MESSHSKDCNCDYKDMCSKGNSVHTTKVVENAIVKPADPNNGDNGNMGISADDNKGVKHSHHEEHCYELTGTKLTDAKTTENPPFKKQNSRKSQEKSKKVSQKLGSKRYPLRSSHVDVRLLSSILKEKNEISSVPVSSTVKEAIKRKKKKKRKKNPTNEFSLIRKRVRYMLTRMKYEQNLIDAYSGEGWKGLSLDKLRPEKELERAKSEILRCKFKIRESFQQLDSLLCEGRLQESLFDANGEIDSEDIFCAKCGLKDLSVDNDIILCDGICVRGFHQMCLNPPLLTEEIPLGDDGWLCPACDCKVDCLELLTESLGIDILIKDTWESVFPEAAAIANGDNLCNKSDYPSDDSEDDDYNPDIPTVDTEGEKEDSSSDKSDSTSLSDESSSLNDKVKFDISALPSDDSEDDDFDPDCSDPNKDIEKEGSISDESDFTSDSDDFCDELSKNANYVSVTHLSDIKQVDDCDEKSKLADNTTINSSVSGKRQQEPLDFKNLNDDAYGKESSESSDDEDWYGNAATKKVKKSNTEPTSTLKPGAEASSTENRRIVQSSMKKLKSNETVEKSNVDLSQASQINGSTSITPVKKSTPFSIGNKSTTSGRRFGEGVIQKLLHYFKENQYPNRRTKERLAEELGITNKQIETWFLNTRHSVKVSTKAADRLGVTFNSSPKEGKRLQTRKSAGAANQPDKPYKEAMDSSEDECWHENVATKKVKKNTTEPTSTLKPEASSSENGGRMRSPIKEFKDSDMSEKSNVNLAQTSQINGSTSITPDKKSSPVSIGNQEKQSTTSGRRFGERIVQKLLDYFKEDQYPNRETREMLAKELGITNKQIETWFLNTRHSVKVSAKVAKRLGVTFHSSRKGGKRL